jgi:hypothetical protein
VAGGIFISYRREDSGGHAGHLHEHLSQHFPRERLFMDYDSLSPGMDFLTTIEQALDSCEVLLAVIGKQWFAIKDDDGRTRLQNENDYVRLEIGTALSRNTTVVPVLVGGATMPKYDALPKALKELARRHAHEISDRRFRDDVEELIRILKNIIDKRAQVWADAARLARSIK